MRLFFALLMLLLLPLNACAYSTNMNASVVMGQSVFTTNSANQGKTPSASSFSNPNGLAVYNGKLIVSDRNNNRVLIFDSIPTSNNPSASVVIGQQNFTAVTANQGGTAAANTLSSPRGIAMAGSKLLISDRSNNRILIYNQLPTSNNASADVVIGQSTFTGTSNGTGANQLFSPIDIDYDPTTGKVFVADSNNRRVVIYDSVPTSNNASATVVVGQSDFGVNVSSCTQNNIAGGTGGVLIIPQTGQLLVSDGSASLGRVLIFNTVPTTNGANADVVIGQSNFTSCSSHPGGVSASTFRQPSDMVYDGLRLIINDSQTHRNLIYDGVPTTNNTAAIQVLGQANFTSQSTNQGGSPAANTASSGQGYLLSIGRNKLIYADRDNARVLIYNNTQTSPNLAFHVQPALTGATISWVTSSAMNAYLESGLTNSFGSGTILYDRSPRTTNHSITLSNLQQCTKYFFQATSNDVALQDVTNEWEFTTQGCSEGAPSTENTRIVENCPPGYTYCIDAGPNHKSDNGFLENSTEAPGVSILVENNASHDDLHITIAKPDLMSLIEAETKITFPWAQGFNVAGEIYRIRTLSAFNGYPIPELDNPGIIILPYDSNKVGSKGLQTIKIARYDENKKTWAPLQTEMVVDPLQNTIATTTKKMDGVFTLVFPKNTR